MSTPNLVITHVAANQNQKEVTINDALDRLDLAMNDTTDIDCTGGDTAIPATDWRENFLLRLVGSPADAFTITVPDGKRIAALHNTTSRTATLRTTSAGNTVALRPGELTIIASRGTDLVPLAASGKGGLYDLALFLPGQPTAGALVFQFVAPRPVSFPADLTGSSGHAGAVATATATFTLRKNGANIGAIAFNAGQSAAGFALPGGASFAPGDVLELLAPTPQDATLADIALSLAGAKA